MPTRSPTRSHILALVKCYSDQKDQFDYFRQQVVGFFETSKIFRAGSLPLVHSVKSRLKDEAHLEEKISRKWTEGPLTRENLFERITDFAGVRVLHLYTKQFERIHNAIVEHVESGYWCFAEPPTAYSWDPEATQYFSSLNLNAVTRDSYYTSIHYVVKPQARSVLSCEIQVRTLFEEAWGEIDHALNYPKKTSSLACKEQLRVLAKLASTGTRLADAIFNIENSERSISDSPKIQTPR